MINILIKEDFCVQTKVVHPYIKELAKLCTMYNISYCLVYREGWCYFEIYKSTSLIPLDKVLDFIHMFSNTFVSKTFVDKVNSTTVNSVIFC